MPTATTSDFQKSSSITATLSTDSNTGYTLTMAGPDDGQNLTGTTINPNTNNLNAIPSISSAISETTFNTDVYDNHWGFLPSKLDSEDNTNYQPGPKKTTPTTVDVTSSATDDGNSNDYTFAIATRVNAEQPKDTYSTTFTLAASANATPYAIGFRDLSNNMPTVLGGSTTAGIVTIPDLSSNPPTKPGYNFKGWCKTATTDNTCSTITANSTTPDIPITGGTYNLSDGAVKDLYAMWEVSNVCSGYYIMQNINSWRNILTGSNTITACDIRDGKAYEVAKLPDGKIWMLDNLALEGPRTLTSADSNVSANFNLPASGTANFNDPAGYTNAATNSGSINTVPSDAISQAGGYKIGVYYNYKAASAGTIEGTSNSISATYDICPKGWRLPTGGSSGEFQAIYNQYNDHTNFRKALHLPLSGSFYNGSVFSRGTVGCFWSATRYDNTNMYGLSLNGSTSTVNPQSYGNRYYGYSVRCITAGS